MNVARFFRTGGFTEHDEVLHLTTRELEVRTDPELPVNVDGEVVTSTPETFTVDANSLDVLVPSHSTAARMDRPHRTVRPGSNQRC